MTPHTVGVTEADIIRWVGVAVGVFGASVAAYDGVVWIRKRAAAFLRGLGQWLRSKLKRNHVEEPKVVNLSGRMESHSSMTGTLSTKWDEDVPTHTEVEILKARIDALETQHSRTQESVALVRVDLSQKVEERSKEARDETSRLSDLIDHQSRTVAQTNAFGLPIIGIGIILTGVPNGLARVPSVGWCVIGIAALLTLACWWGAVVSRRAGRDAP